MSRQPPKIGAAKLSALSVGLVCLIALCNTSAHADTLTITGSSDTQNPLVSSLAGQVEFLGRVLTTTLS